MPLAKPIIKTLPYRPVGPVVRIAPGKVGNFRILKNAQILKSRQVHFNGPQAFDEIYRSRFTEAWFYDAFFASVVFGLRSSAEGKDVDGYSSAVVL